MRVFNFTPKLKTRRDNSKHHRRLDHYSIRCSFIVFYRIYFLVGRVNRDTTPLGRQSNNRYVSNFLFVEGVYTMDLALETAKFPFIWNGGEWRWGKNCRVSCNASTGARFCNTLRCEDEEKEITFCPGTGYRFGDSVFLAEIKKNLYENNKWYICRV